MREGIYCKLRVGLSDALFNIKLDARGWLLLIDVASLKDFCCWRGDSLINAVLSFELKVQRCERIEGYRSTAPILQLEWKPSRKSSRRVIYAFRALIGRSPSEESVFIQRNARLRPRRHLLTALHVQPCLDKTDFHYCCSRFRFFTLAGRPVSGVINRLPRRKWSIMWQLSCELLQIGTGVSQGSMNTVFSLFYLPCREGRGGIFLKRNLKPQE